MTKVLGKPVLISSKFAANYRGELISKGCYELKGVAETHELFTLAAKFPGAGTPLDE